jgi:aryl-alcohol dehydrogenase-like predicted oxidoreductase
MKQRRLGTSGPLVSAMGLGCWGMSGTYGSSDEAQAIATIHRALELGITLLDTADGYGRGHNEELVGRAIRDRRDRAFVATKFGRLYGPPPNDKGVNGSPEYVRSACELSLRRLGIETIDLYYYHRVDPTVPVAETVGAMAELVRAGKVRYLGISEATPEEIRAATATHPIAALQSEYSLFTRDLEDNGILATIRELGITLVPYYVVGRGLLGGKVTANDAFESGDGRRRAPRFDDRNFAKNLSVVERFRALARKFGATPAQLAIAWVLAQGEDIVPIPGTKRVAYLEENAAAAEIKLDPGRLAQIEAVVPKGVAAGARSSDPLTRV